MITYVYLSMTKVKRMWSAAVAGIFRFAEKKGECIGHALLMALRIQLYSAVQRCIVYSYTSLNTIQHAIQPLQYTPLCSDSAECAVSLIKLAELT